MAKDPDKKKNRNWVPIVTLIFQTLAEFFSSLKLPLRSAKGDKENSESEDSSDSE